MATKLHDREVWSAVVTCSNCGVAAIYHEEDIRQWGGSPCILCLECGTLHWVYGVLPMVTAAAPRAQLGTGTR